MLTIEKMLLQVQYLKRRKDTINSSLERLYFLKKRGVSVWKDEKQISDYERDVANIDFDIIKLEKSIAEEQKKAPPAPKKPEPLLN